MKAIITGSTGMVGKGVLLECLDSADVESVLVINRRSIGMKHKKLKEIILSDFFDLGSIEDDLKGYNACFFCLGVSAAGMSEEAYRHITYDLTLQFAEMVLSLNQDMTFCYVSGAGTDSSEKSRMMWARVKGKTENDLLKMPFRDAYMFRPGFIQPMKGIRSSTSLYNVMYMLFKPFYPLLKRFPSFATTTEILGKAMIAIAKDGADKKVLESKDINQILKK